MEQLTWTQTPETDGTYWYVDADFPYPEQVQVSGTETGDTRVLLDDFHHKLEDLSRDGAHFYGPVPEIIVPEIPEELRARLDEIDAERYAEVFGDDEDEF